MKDEFYMDPELPEVGIAPLPPKATLHKHQKPNFKAPVPRFLPASNDADEVKLSHK